MFENDFIGAR